MQATIGRSSLGPSKGVVGTCTVGGLVEKEKD